MMAVSAEVKEYQLLIDGKLVPSSSGETFEIYNPATNEVIGRVAKATREDVDRAVRAARRAFDEGPWGRMTPNERAKRLRRVAEIIRERQEELSRIETINSGKIIVESRADVANSANCFEYYANLTGQIWGETIPMNGPLFDYTVREPYGVCGQIVPWNFPILMAAWKIAPALAAGNTVVLKPASYTPITALLLGQICLEAGIPEGVVNIITGPGNEIGAALCEHPLVDKIAFTGETETGREILRLSAGTIKKVSLELGGKSPNIVFPDADLEEAVNGSLFAIFSNAGQRCTARTRLFLHRSIHDRFLADFVDKAGRIRLGDPLDDQTQMGPLVSPRQCQRVLHYVERAKSEGAVLRLGGKKPEAPALQRGNFVEPTVFDQVTQQMTIAREEVFGPVLSVIPFESEDEVVQLANDTIYGLGATIWTKDIKRAHRLASRIRAGNISINYPVINPPEAPFGGYKQSGIGRELSRHVLDLYTQVKNVVVGLSEEPFDWYGRWPAGR
ncbi:aldehyde dehydrogenase family protein [Thermorudis peleae]|uniref:aldehyde dehydrogenase family protein n=1 Tax=Thermorudis peleae TaxID=1382356 RepID=UPI001E4CFCB1|nr:aldehyde dehydrogenase family protein [Thermorudis peleae]